MKTLAGYFKLEDNVWQHYYVDYPRMWELTPLYAVEDLSAAHTLNKDKTVAVSTDTYWQPIETCPRAVKVQLLGKGGVATYGLYNGDKFWENWCPLPKKAKA
jgi:hypothetical protein